MESGICNLSIIPVRSEPSDRSEMVTQVLFGEHFEIIEKQKNWIRIRLAYDGYEGWMDAKQSAPLSLEDFHALNKSNPHVSRDIVQVAVYLDPNPVPVPILMGSTLPFFKDNELRISERLYNYVGSEFCFELPDKKMLIENAYLYFNAPYLWGGRGPFGIDCSGFTQMVYKMSGMKLLRDANQQADQGLTIEMLENAEPGDLLFFDNEEGKIVHVGILVKPGKIIHASGQVKVNDVDHHGIFNKEMNKYTHTLRLIKRMI